MTCKLIAFGIARDILGGKISQISLNEPYTVQGLLETLKSEYPRFEDLASIKVAVNTEYAPMDLILGPDDEIVLIPPVSGG
ncbi:MAG: MoaD/ThiS family protein [Bacteroidota bacterium]